jgi:hypothetical protein
MAQTKIDPCALLPPGALKDACTKTQDQVNNSPPSSNGSSFFGIPIPGSDWMRHMMFRVGEVIVGIAMIVVGIKAFTSGSQTINVITKTAKKYN